MRLLKDNRLSALVLVFFYLLFFFSSQYRLILLEVSGLGLYFLFVFRNISVTLFFLTVILLPFERNFFSLPTEAVSYLGNPFHLQPTYLSFPLFSLPLLPLIAIFVFEIRKKSFSKENVMLLLYSVTFICSYLLGLNPNRSGSAILAFFTPLFLYFLAKDLTIIKVTRKYLFIILLVSVLFQETAAIMQLVNSNPLGIVNEATPIFSPFGRVANENRELFRITGLTSNPFYLGGMIALVLPLLSLQLFRIPLIGSQIFYAIFWLLSAASLTFTYVRSLWLICIISVIVLFFLYRYKFHLTLLDSLKPPLKKIIMGFAIAIFVILAPNLLLRFQSITTLFSENSSSGTFRLRMLTESWNVIKNYPIFGIGANNFEYSLALQKYLNPEITINDVHFLFAQIAIAFGIPGLLFFLAFLYLNLQKGIRIYQNINLNQKLELLALGIGVLNILLLSFTYPLLFTPLYNYLFLGMGVLNGYEKES